MNSTKANTRLTPISFLTPYQLNEVQQSGIAMAASQVKRFPIETDDYNGRDLRVVLSEGSFDRPSWWPATDNEPPVVHCQIKPANPMSISDAA